MSNPYFVPSMSSNEIYRNRDTSRCLTDDLDAMDEAIEELQENQNHTHTEYAAADHTHTGYAATNHSHTAASVGAAEADHAHSQYAGTEHTHTPASIGAAATNHSHTPAAIGAAADDHTHSQYAGSQHSHTPASIGAATATHSHAPEDIGAAEIAHGHTDLADADHTHSEYANATHAHSQYATTGHTHADKADLVNGKVPISQIPNEVKEVQIVANIAARNALTGLFAGLNVYVEDAAGDSSVASGGAYYLYNGTGWIKTAESESMDLVMQWANIQGAPTSMPANGGNADTVDNKHASDFATADHTHTAAAVGAAAASHTHTPASIGAAAAAHSHSAADVGAAAASHSHTAADVGAAASNHTHSQYAATGHGHSAADVGAAAASHTHTPASIGAAASTHSHDYAATNHAHSAADVGAAAANHSHNYAATNHAHTAADVGAAAASHSHDYAAPNHNHNFAAPDHTHTAAAVGAIAAALMFTNEIGGVQYSYGSDFTGNLLTTMAAWPQGLHTAYVIAGKTGTPPVAGESWRIIAHKTSGTIGWILAFGSSGSIYSNYQNGETTFRGWRAIYDYGGAPLWKGTAYMQSVNSEPQTITPSKKLSECRTGWLLLWSDYDPNTGTVNDSDFCTTIIPKRNPSGGTWGGKAFYCDIPMYVGDNANDLSTEKRCIKPIYVHDDCIKGSYQNTSGGRNDVVLRAVYEI